MKTAKYLPYVLITGLILIVILQRECSTPAVKPVVILKDTTIYKVDTFVLNKIVLKPQPYAVIDTFLLHDTIFKTHKDTVNAIIDYSFYRKYDLSLINDSFGIVNCLVDVQFNKIAKYQLKGTLYDRTKIIEHNYFVVEEKRNKVFAGVQFGYSILNPEITVKPTLQLLTKKEHLYSASYEPFKQGIEVGVFWKIKLKK